MGTQINVRRKAWLVVMESRWSAAAACFYRHIARIIYYRAVNGRVYGSKKQAGLVSSANNCIDILLYRCHEKFYRWASLLLRMFICRVDPWRLLWLCFFIHENFNRTPFASIVFGRNKIALLGHRNLSWCFQAYKLICYHMRIVVSIVRYLFSCCYRYRILNLQSTWTFSQFWFMFVYLKLEADTRIGGSKYPAIYFRWNLSCSS